MKKFFVIFIILYTFILYSSSENGVFYIIHTNDIHAHILSENFKGNGLDKIVYFVKKFKKEHPNTIYVDSGDFLDKGDIVDHLSSGEYIYKVLSFVPYDAVTLGNHDIKNLILDNGKTITEHLLNITQAPFISCNVISTKSENLITKPYVIKNLNKIKIGLIGGIYTMPIELTEPLKIISLKKEIPKYIDILKHKGVKVFVLILHEGVRNAREIGKEFTELNIIIAGHDHKFLPQPLKINSTYIFEVGSYAKHIGVGKFFYTNRELYLKNYQTIDTKALKSDENFTKKVKKIRKGYIQKLNRILAYNATPFNGKKEEIEWTAKVYAKYIPFDFILLPKTSVSYIYPEGEITLIDLCKKYMYRNPIYLCPIKGRYLKKISQLVKNRYGRYLYFYPEDKIKPERLYFLAIDNWTYVHWEYSFIDIPKPIILKKYPDGFTMEKNYLTSKKMIRKAKAQKIEIEEIEEIDTNIYK